MKMISMSDSSSSEEEDSRELQRLKDAAVTLESDGDLHASPKVPTNVSVLNEEANSSKVSQSSSRPSLRPKQTYSVDSSELKMTPGFKTHVAKKLSDILDKELEFSESVVEKSSENNSSDSGIRLLSSSKNFLTMAPNAEIPKQKIDPNLEIQRISKWNPVWKPKSRTKHKTSTSDKHVSSNGCKRVNPNSNKQTDSSSDKNITSTSDSSDDERLAEAAVSFWDIKKKDELISSFAISSAPILIIQADKNKTNVKDGLKSDVEVEAKANGSSIKKKKKKHKKEKKENEESEEESRRKKKKKKEFCSFENNQSL